MSVFIDNIFLPFKSVNVKDSSQVLPINDFVIMDNLLVLKMFSSLK